MVCHQIIHVYGLTTSIGRLGGRLLTGTANQAGPIPVDVHVRSYEETLPPAPRVAGPESGYGCLPVGSILDCYL